MRRYSIPFLLLFALFSFVFTSRAQTPADALDALQVSFWPDYDDPSVLVLLTGVLPADTTLPAQVTVPIPAGARVNAVAAVTDNGLATITYESNDDSITFAAPENGFRVEYYVPYELNGSTRSFRFSWQSALDIADFTAEIQQPVNATNLTSDPAAIDQITGQTDGLIYHILPTRAVASGAPYEISFSYDMLVDALTAGQPAPPVQDLPATPVTTEPAGETNWLLIGSVGLGLLALAIGGTWFVATRSQPKRKSTKPLKPAPKRQTAPPAKPATGSRFCHVCGQAAEPGDRFCRNCGTQIKQT